ncbi:MAG: pentapeptide repeat-containing protein [Chloroflexota bacterium]|nr:pentapeptide repeat-containing protein [Chloroflexota bacterium]
MPLIHRVRQTLGKRWYAIMPTDKLIALIGDQNHSGNTEMLINALKERLAHQDGSLDHLDWSSTTLTGALLSSCRLKHARFSAAQLRGAYFGYSNVCSADFTGADLRRANLREARMTNAIFDRANLQEANFARAILRDCAFVAADLSQANLWGADLRGANLTEASMVNCNVSNVIVDQSTTMPSGEAYSEDIRWGEFTRASRH